jgi:pyruvate dehydrogenase E2 component (dihydrolipoamide acetyltransferase)
MRKPFLMPKLGLTMTEGSIVEWKLKPGQAFNRGQIIFVVETDKSAVDIESERAGVVLEIVHLPGKAVSVGEVLGYWDDGEGGANSESAVESQLQKNSATPVTAVHSVEVFPAQQQGNDIKRIVATPFARRLARKFNIDLHKVSGSGPNGRIKAADLPLGPATTQPTASQLILAKRLVGAKQNIPHFYLSLEVEVSELLALRFQLNSDADVRVSVNDLFVAAAGRALLDCPQVDRVWSEDGIIRLGSTDVGIAVHSPQGLFAPIVRGAGRMTVRQIAEKTRPMLERVRKGRLNAREMGGGSLTISNAGMFDVTYITPIINPGQAMILGIGSVREVFRPDVNCLPSLRREVGVVLACDHRILDGVAALNFLQHFKKRVQQPQLLTTLE